MRIATELIEQIRQTVKTIDPEGKLWLFGSRVDDSKRGGDIDLYLETSHRLLLKESIELEYRLANLSDEKVDLVIRNPEQTLQTIHQMARQGVAL